MIRILKAVQTALNLIPKTKLNVHGFDDTYDLASVVDAVVMRFPPIRMNEVAPFNSGDVVRHVKTKGVYRIVLTPAEGMMDEKSGLPGYLYTPLTGDDRKFWPRPASEFEDGRFERLVVAPTTRPWPRADQWKS